MKTKIFTLIFLVSATITFSQIKGYTEYDDEVWLYDDGTWEYAYELPLDVETIIMERPIFSGAFGSNPAVKAPKITQLSAKENQITDDEEWFLNNDLSLKTYEVPNNFRSIVGDIPAGTPVTFEGERIVKAFYDDTYNYFIYGVDFSEGRYLVVANREIEGASYIFDFESYRMSPDYVKEDQDYIAQRLNWARIENGILYVSHSHSTYAASSKGMNAYITAISLEDNSVLWRSQPLVSNGANFILHNDVIVCGYGFTNEKDYIYTLDKNTGKVNGKLLLKSGPSYFVLKDNVFYVRTYNMDYTFKID